MTTVFKISLHIDRENGNKLLFDEDFEHKLGAHAIGLKPKSDDTSNGLWIIEAYCLEQPTKAQVLKSVSDVLGTETNALIDIETLPNEDWVSKVQSELRPVHVGRFSVYGSHDKHLFTSRRFALEVNAAQAFGTAHHGTTQGCLTALDRLLKKQTFKTILDLGTGSGVLAIAAAKTQITANIIATDIDAISLDTARTNFKMNNVQPRIHTVLAPGLKHKTLHQLKSFDLVMANILAKPLKRLAYPITQVLQPGGYLILSGLLTHQARDIIATYNMCGLTLQNCLHRNNWATLIMLQRHNNVKDTYS